MEKATRRGNYESGSDYVLEYGELRFSFNEHDFSQRVEQAAVKLDGEIWTAECPEGAAGGETVEVVAVEGLTLVVRRV